MHIEGAVRRPIRKLVPSPNGEINVVLAAPGASILHQYSNGVALATDPVIASRIRSLDPAAAVRTWRLVLHPIIADGGDNGVVTVDMAARTGSAALEVDGSATVVPGKRRL